MNKWEYLTEMIAADALEESKFLSSTYPGVEFPKFAVQAAMPRLDELGSDGWELVHMEPVRLGANGDVGDLEYWTNIYFCVFKRPKL